MIRRLALIAVVMMLWSSAVFAQGFASVWGYYDQPGLKTVCPPSGTINIPDGAIIKIYWDSNGGGPDASDPLATLCTEPPLCDTGPVGTCNFNQFTLNGASYLEEPGCFLMETAFTSAENLPSPPRFYLGVEYPAGVRMYTSTVQVLASGYQEINLTAADWTCGDNPQCVVRNEHE